MKDQSIAKLCSQCEDYYAEAVKLMDKEPVLESLDKEWTCSVSDIYSNYLLFYYKNLIILILGISKASNLSWVSPIPSVHGVQRK